MNFDKKNKLVQILNYHGTRDIINYYIEDIRTLDLLKFLNEDKDFYENIIDDFTLDRKKNKDYEVKEYKNIFNCIKWFLQILLKVCKCYRNSEGKKYGELKDYLFNSYVEIFTHSSKQYSSIYNMFREIKFEGEQGSDYIFLKDEFKNNPEDRWNYRYWFWYETFINRYKLRNYLNNLDDIYNKKRKNKKTLYNWLDKFTVLLENKLKDLNNNFSYYN